jgi:sensor histidine kinase YesM
MGPRLQVELDLPEALRALPVPPLLLQPLVENAIQHGLEPKVEGGRLTVRARRDGDQLVLTVLDTGVGLPEADPNRPALPASDPGRGFGTTQVRERLATRWNGAARFELRPARAEDVAEHGAAAHSPGPDATPPGGTLARIVLPLP